MNCSKVFPCLHTKPRWISRDCVSRRIRPGNCSRRWPIRIACCCCVSFRRASAAWASCALEVDLGIRQPTLSQQLAVLRREQLVDTRREGKQIFYRISSPQALAVINTLYQLFCGSEE